MFGLQEILIITAIIVGILFIPRMTAKKPAVQQIEYKLKLSGKMRTALAASLIYPALIAAFIQPWKKEMILFLYLGIGPVLLGWLLFWIFIGFKK